MDSSVLKNTLSSKAATPLSYLSIISLGNDQTRVKKFATQQKLPHYNTKKACRLICKVSRMILSLPANFKQASQSYKLNKFYLMWGKGHGQVARKSRQYENELCKRIRQFLQQRFANRILDVEKVVEMMMGYLLEDDKLAKIIEEMVSLYLIKMEKESRKMKFTLEIQNEMIKEKIQRCLSKFIRREYAKHKKNVNYIELSDQDDTTSLLNPQKWQQKPKPIESNQEQQMQGACLQITNHIIQQESLAKQQIQKEQTKQCPKIEGSKTDQSLSKKIKKGMKNDSERQKKPQLYLAQRQIIEQTNISETTVKDKDASEEKEGQISLHPAIGRQFTETQQFGHFLFGDHIDRILDVIPIGKNLNEHAALIEWKIRENGFKPNHSIMTVWDVKYFQIMELITFFENREKIRSN